MIGLGIGVGWATKRRLVNYINELIKQFKTRVAADGGTFEAEQCLKDSLPALIENEPSLCVTPNAVEAGKLFSIIPTNGAGDLDVVRATSATRVDENGLIEIPTTNLLLQSEVFTNGWTLESSTISANTTIAPNGTLTADTLSEVFANDIHRTYRSAITTIVGQNYAFSFYVKKDTSRYVRLSIVTSGASINVWSAVQFDLDTQTFTSGVGSGGGTFLNASILELADGWFRISMTGTATSTSTFFMLSLSNGSAILSSDSRGCVAYLGNTANKIIIWGAQLEQGITATEYIPTTTVVRTRFAGITQDGSSASNIARLDYTNGSCPSILVEPQRTNLTLYSEDFSNAYWAKLSAGLSPNVAISPDGTMTADLLNPNGSGTFPRIEISSLTLPSAGTYTFSIFAKKKVNDKISIHFENFIGSTPATLTAYFDLTLGTTPTAGASIIELPDGWYRCIIQAITIVSGDLTGTLQILTTPSTTQRNWPTAALSTGQSVFLWGAQLEQGSNYTSYIPTTTASVTRNADLISKTGISDLIGQTEGTLFADVYINSFSSTGMILSTCIDTTAVRIEIYKTTNGKITFDIIGNTGALAGVSSTSTFTGNVRLKIALGYKSGDTVMFINGIQETTVRTTTYDLTGQNRVGLGQNRNNVLIFNDFINNASLFKTRLTNTELQQLTTL